LTRGGVVGRVKRDFSSKFMNWVWSSPSLSFSGYWNGWSVKLTTNLHGVLGLQNGCSYTYTPSWHGQRKLYI
jgi:hypothetical protein